MAGSGQQLEMKIFRHVTGIGDPNVYQVVGSDGPRSLTPSVLNTFPTNIAVRPGDFLGINTENANPGPPNTACYFSAPGDAFIVRAGNLPDGGTGDFAPVPDFRLNLTAVVGFQPANEFTFGKTTRNRNKGTAKLVVSVPGPGTLTLTGKGVKAQRPARDAVASKVVTAAGKVSLTIRPKGKAKQKLNKTGKAKVKVKVTYTPSANGSDVAGDPKTQTKRVKLIKKG